MSPWKPWRLGVSRRLGYRDPVRQTFGYGPQYGEHSLNGYPLGCLPAAGSVPYAGERMTEYPGPFSLWYNPFRHHKRPPR
jgi:hypothetical protein